MICKECNTAISESDLFCAKCGSKVEALAPIRRIDEKQEVIQDKKSEISQEDTSDVDNIHEHLSPTIKKSALAKSITVIGVLLILYGVIAIFGAITSTLMPTETFGFSAGNESLVMRIILLSFLMGVINMGVGIASVKKAKTLDNNDLKLWIMEGASFIIGSFGINSIFAGLTLNEYVRTNFLLVMELGQNPGNASITMGFVWLLIAAVLFALQFWKKHK